MQAVSGGVVFLVIALVFAGRCQNDFRQMLSGRATLNAPTATEQPRTTGFTGDPAKIAEAIAAIKPIATGQNRDKKGNVKMTVTAEDINRANEQKIAVAAPLVLDALNECPKAIPPEQLTSHWGNETDFCPGLPVRMCPVSAAGARTPLQLMPDTIKQYAKAGEDPETLAVSLKVAVRHLCFAKGKGNIELDPASDAAILRYNASTEYLKNIRAVQAKHAPIWASIRSGNGSMIASNTTAPTPIPVPPGCERTPRGNIFCPGASTQEINFFPTVPLTRPATWVSSWGDRRNHDGTIVPHGGFDAGCHATGEPLVAACDGKIVVAGMGNDGRAGKMVAVECGDYKVTCEHMDRIDVTVGQTVAAHQQIGTCGHTGNAEPKPGEAPAPHAHIQLAVRNGNDWKNMNPCAGPKGSTILRCSPLLMGPETRLNPIRDVVASN